MGFESMSPRFRSTDFLSLRPDCQARPPGSRYVHIVAPTSLTADDSAVLRLGIEMAAAHGAKLTVLHVVPPAEDECLANVLDALALLHRALERIHQRPQAQAELSARERARLRVAEFLNRVVPEHQRTGVEIDVECRTGAIADSIARFAEESAADLVIVSTGRSRRWLPILPARVRRLLQLSRQQIILVSPDARARKESPLRARSDAVQR